MDPATVSLIMGGLDFAGNMFGGPSEAEKAAMENAKLNRDMFETREKNRGTATQFADARARAQMQLRNQLMGHIGGIREPSVDLSSAFRDPTNAFSRPQAGSGVVSAIQPPQFTPEAMGSNLAAMPSAPTAKPRATGLLGQALKQPGAEGMSRLMPRGRRPGGPTAPGAQGGGLNALPPGVIEKLRAVFSGGL